jgi:hypothetical protein
MTKHVLRTTIAILTLSPLALGIAAAGSDQPTRTPQSARPLRLDEASMIIEVNASDRDAGLQVFLDGEPWRAMKVFYPDGRKIVDIEATSRLSRYGLTELFSESSEPSFDEFPLRKFKRLFPEGRYTFRGRSIGGRRMVGSARLSHDIPDGPDITSPAEGETVPSSHAVASWNPVPETEDINIVGYRAIVEREDPLRVFSVDLPASVTSVTIPAEFLQSGVDYKLEVQAIEASGNQTLTEIEFSVS